jgi:hypothetical protein
MQSISGAFGGSTAATVSSAGSNVSSVSMVNGLNIDQSQVGKPLPWATDSGLSWKSVKDTAAPFVSGIGNFLQASSQAQQYKSQAQNYKTNASLSRFNQEMAIRDANATIRAYDIAQKKAASSAKGAISSIRAGYAKSGIVTTSGTALLAQQEQAMEGELAVQNLAFEGSMRASGFRTDAAMYGAQAATFDQSSANIKQAGKIASATSILTGIFNAR